MVDIWRGKILNICTRKMNLKRKQIVHDTIGF